MRIRSAHQPLATTHTNTQLTANVFQLLDAIEEDVKAGGCIIDWHACDLFPRSWIDLVVVLRVNSSTLYDRLTAR
jgi:broad-specificity NMP kinase